MTVRKVVILGAAGRDFHDFNVLYRGNAGVRVIAFTASQIPNIAGRNYPPALAGPGYPEGIPIVPERDLGRLLEREEVDEVVLAYSDLPHEEVMHKASIALASGARFVLPGPRETELRSQRPVISVCAVRTGAGKSPVTRYLARLLRQRGLRVAVLRHPMPYGDLEAQAVQRFRSLGDLDAARCTVEEREEYEPHLREGGIVFAGVDYERIVQEAEKEADILLWDGGNNDTPFLRSDLRIVVADPHRPGHELAYHPGEANLRMADIVVIGKTDSASPGAIARVEANARRVNPHARLLRSGLTISAVDPERLRGRHVLVIEDGPTLTHGGMAYGAGTLLAKRHGALLVDPRPGAVGSIAQAYRDFPHLGPVLPALGYGAEQVRDLEGTIQRSGAEIVVDGSPVDLGRIVRLTMPIVNVRYELEDPEGVLASEVGAFLARSRPPGSSDGTPHALTPVPS